jgi:hypothetical protein
MKTPVITVAIIWLFLVAVVSAHADESDKRIIHDEVTDRVLKVCYDHQRILSAQDNSNGLDAPSYSDDKLVAWVTAALPNIISLDYATIEQELIGGERYFTPYGWCEFIAATSDAGLIDATITRKLAVRIILHAAPTITQRIARNGVYSWTVETPVSFTFKSGGMRVSDLPDVNDIKLVVRISRSSSKTNPDGIGIFQWVVVPDHF